MAERYRKLFDLEHRLWAPDAPVVLEAGSLLEDQSSGSMLCQLKIRNIQPRAIKALRAVVQLQDDEGKPLGKAVDHRYQGLELRRDEQAGADQAIVLPSRDGRRFIARITQISFADGEIWTDGGQEWQPLSDRILLEDRLDPPDEDRFRARFGKDSVYAPADDGALWLCTCGAVGLASEGRCHVCRRKAAPQLELLAHLLGQEPPRTVKRARSDEDDEPLEETADWSRGPEAPEDAPDRNEDAQEDAPLPWIQKFRWVIWLLLLLLVGGLATSLALPRIRQAKAAAPSAAQSPAVKVQDDLIEQALALLEQGDYRGAVAAFHALGIEGGHFSPAQKQEAYRFAAVLQERAETNDAEALVLIGSSAEELSDEDSPAAVLYQAAEDRFLALGDYSDSADRAAQCREAMDAREALRLQMLYDNAAAMLDRGEYTAARALFLSLGDYSDSAEQAKESLYRRALDLYRFAEDNDIASLYAALPDDSGGRFVLSRERALALGAEELERLADACGADGAKISIGTEPEIGMLPLERALEQVFRSLGDYRDSAVLAEQVLDFADGAEIFFSLCAENDLDGARDWLANGRGRFEDRERWAALLDGYASFDREWKLSTGDPTLLSVMLGDDQPVYSIRTLVVLDRDGATLRIFPGEDESQFAELRAELGDEQFVMHLDKGGYLAEVSGTGRLSLIRFLDGAVLGGAEYEPK